jgi:sterol-4alpha-carboxylate 3-dehydrogenase (decarboxylating)
LQSSHNPVTDDKYTPKIIHRPGDRQVVPGIVKVFQEGRSSFQVGAGNNLFDYVYIDNAVQAHILAASRLTSPPIPLSTFEDRLRPVDATLRTRTIPTSVEGHKDPPIPAQRSYFDTYSPVSPISGPTSVAGEIFYITNGEPFPFWSFVRAIYAAYDPTASTRVWALPVPVAFLFASLGEMWGKLMGREVALTTERVEYSVSHLWTNIEKARRILGYEPKVGMEEGIRKAVAVRHSPYLVW